MGKGEIARNEQFILFPAVFSTRLREISATFINLKLSSANSFSLEESKICRLGKGKPFFVHTMVSRERGMNPITITVINLWTDIGGPRDSSYRNPCSQVVNVTHCATWGSPSWVNPVAFVEL